MDTAGEISSSNEKDNANDTNNGTIGVIQQNNMTFQNNASKVTRTSKTDDWSFGSSTKRATTGNITYQGPERKRVNYSTDNDKKPFLPGHIHGRWLVESHYCSRVLGPGGKRFKNMRLTVNEQGLITWISPNIQHAKYRVFNCIGTPMGISKIVALYVKSLYEPAKPEDPHIDNNFYDLKFLVPKQFTEEIKGVSDSNLREIEKRSNAIVHIDSQPFYKCDEQCMHIYGVSDAIRIAVYFTLKTLQRVFELTNFDIQNSQLNLYSPQFGDPPKQTCNWSFTSKSIKEKHGSPYQSPENYISGMNSSEMNFETDRQDKEVYTKIPMDVEEPKINAAPEFNPYAYILPSVKEQEKLSPNVYTAFDVARDSNRSSLRQMLHIPYKGSSESEREFLVENIRRVTECSADIITTEKHDFMGDSGNLNDDDHEIAVVIEGPPSENLLALFLIYRFLLKKIQK